MGAIKIAPRKPLRRLRSYSELVDEMVWTDSKEPWDGVSDSDNPNQFTPWDGKNEPEWGEEKQRHK